MNFKVKKKDVLNDIMAAIGAYNNLPAELRNSDILLALLEAGKYIGGRKFEITIEDDDEE